MLTRRKVTDRRSHVAQRLRQLAVRHTWAWGGCRLRILTDAIACRGNLPGYPPQPTILHANVDLLNDSHYFQPRHRLSLLSVISTSYRLALILNKRKLAARHYHVGWAGDRRSSLSRSQRQFAR